jgi:hypothetical protein
MYKSIRYFTLLALFVLLMACEKEIGFRPKAQIPFLVMNSYLNPDSIIAVSLSKSISIAAKLTLDIVGDAEVNVYEDEQLLETLKFDAANRRYRGTGKPSVGKKYKITVAKNGFLPIDATTVIEPAPKVLAFSASKDPNSGKLIAALRFNDQEGVANFYRLVVKTESEFTELPEWADKSQNTSRSGWKGNTFYEYRSEVYSDDPILDWQKKRSTGGLLTDEPENLFIIFNDELIDGKDYSLSFSYYFSGAYGANSNKTIVYFQAISKELYRYLKTISVVANFGGSPIWEPVQVFSNVNNGGGILGSYNTEIVSSNF